VIFHPSINVTDWNFFLKKWWVRWQLWRLRLYQQPAEADPITAYMANQEDEEREMLRTLVKEEVKYQTQLSVVSEDSILFLYSLKNNFKYGTLNFFLTQETWLRALILAMSLDLTKYHTIG
jgi:hypothetical protein